MADASVVRSTAAAAVADGVVRVEDSVVELCCRWIESGFEGLVIPSWFGLVQGLRVMVGDSLEFPAVDWSKVGKS